METFCDVFSGVCGTAFFASTFVETHLSVSLLAALCRSSRALCFLERTLPAAWPLAVVASVYAIVDVDTVWTKGECTRGKHAVLEAAVQGGCLIISVCVYFLSCRRVERHFGFAVQTRVWSRARGFLAAWLICLCPEVLRSALMPASDVLKPYTFVLLNLNGLSNTIVYFLQGNYARRRVRYGPRRLIPTGAREASSNHSFLVSLGNVSSASNSSVRPSFDIEDIVVNGNEGSVVSLGS